MNWILGVIFILVVIYLITRYQEKKRIEKLKQELIKNWGKPKQKDFFNFQSIAQYFEKNEHKNQAFHLISDKVKTDLDIDQVFKFIDRTSSKIGQQFLYFKIRTISSIEELKKFSSFSAIFSTNEVLRLKCQLLLSNLNSTESYDLERLFTNRSIEKPKFLKLVYTLAFASVLFIFLSFLNPLFSLFLLPIFLVNSVLHYKNKDNINYYVDGVNQLNKSLIVSKQLATFKEIKDYFPDFSFLQKIGAIHLKTKFIGFEKQLNTEFAALAWLLIELIKIQFNIEFIVFFSFIDSITKEKKNIEKMYVFIGEIDAAIATASVKAGNSQICTPNFSTKKQCVIKGISHPLIENCIPNDLNLINESLLLTGSNMSGKTTFIRTIAINSILAQTLDICFAESYDAPFFKVYSSIRITDDLLDKTSYYLEEVLTVKELVYAAEQEEQPCLFILDEIFKGTNTIERISGGKAILKYLNQKKHVVFVSTHDIELTELLVQENYELYHFSEKIDQEELIFDHKLKVGKLKTRNAIKILELYKYPPEIIADAKKTELENFR